MSHLTTVTERRNQLVDEAVIHDCIRVIETEYEKTLHTGKDALTAMLAKMQKTKGYGG